MDGNAPHNYETLATQNNVNHDKSDEEFHKLRNVLAAVRQENAAQYSAYTSAVSEVKQSLAALTAAKEGTTPGPLTLEGVAEGLGSPAAR